MPRSIAASAPPADTPIGIELRLLGAPCLVVGERRVGLSAKDAALLCLVALAGPIRADRVAVLLWPAATAKQADTNLRQRLYRLRHDAGIAIASSGALLQLPAEVRVDMKDRLERVGRDERVALDTLLGDLDYDELPELAEWVQGQRRQWRERGDAALAAAAAQCEKEGALARGLVYAQRLVDSEPLAEHAQRRLMRLHYLRGDRAAAIAAFERFEQRLKDEQGTRPSAETIELLATIERGAASLPARRALAPASLMRPPRLIGRERELEALDHAWSTQRAFLVVGEAGIGKSRLLQEFAAGRPGVVGVQARPGDAGIAYAVLARLLRAVLAASPAEIDATRTRELALVLPELGPAVALAGAAQRLLLHRSVDATLAEAVGRGLAAVIVDDLHFADDASIEFVQSLVQSETLAALRWGFAQRPAEAAAAVTQMRGALEDAGLIESTAVRPLDLAQLVTLVESIGLAELDAAQLAPALLRHTGGNPMFALETLKDLVLSGSAGASERGIKLPQPVTVGALIQRRLGQLSSEALRLARAAALAGPAFTAELAVVVLEVHPLDIAEPWRELEAAQVIRDGAFAHDLIFEATRASIPAPIAELLHRRIAVHLREHQAVPESIAPHWAGAGEWQLAGAAYAGAARRAQSASQRTHEVECWRLAADAFDRAGAADSAFDARCESVHALIVVQGVTHANTLIDALLAAAQSAPQRAAALTARATAALMAADHQAGIAAAALAGELARTFESPWPGFEAARLHAVGLAQSGRAVEALAMIEPYRALVEGEASAEQRGRFWADYAYVLNAARRLRDTAFALQQAIDNAEALGDVAEQATLTSNLATVRGNLGQVPEALALAQRSLALQARLGATDGPEGAVVATYAGLYCGMVGRYREALQHLDTALTCFARDKQVVWIAVASNHKAQLLIELGQFARARQALAYEAPTIDHVRARGAAIGARVERALGHSGTAQLDHAVAALTPGADPNVRMHVMLESGAGDDPMATVRRCDDVVQMALGLDFAGVAMKARLLRAHALSRAGATDSAAQAMRELVPQLATLQPADLYLAEAWWLAAQVFEASGDSDQALMALAHGTQWIRRVALPEVPDEFRDSFLHRNPTNRALLATAERRLAR
ncbi:MAG TPA: AAA family ATPase [Caldimonas sp.]|jgi:DNA-binding SARP family transcriptional activator/tetratricopeptide (TPR) repeat protein|nr:AAA family ATPase [Caldimonas sp.]